jgi:hypothetical protein
MFAAIYQGYLNPGCEKEYQKLWKIIATYFVEKRGALGSCLHKNAEGLWVAYSRWPDQATRDASWPGENAPSEELPDEVRQAILGIKACMDQDRKIPDLSLNVVEDLLLSPHQ